jgi:hypothetical protein
MLWPTVHDHDLQWDYVGSAPKALPDQRRVLVVGDLLGAVAAESLAKDDQLAVWSLSDPGCPFDVGSDRHSFRDGDHPLALDASCGHWQRRWPRGVAAFDPDVVVIGGGYWDTLSKGSAEPAPAALHRSLPRLIARQVDAARGTGDPQIVLLRVDDWSKLVDSKQRPLDDRLAALDAYNRAIEEVAAGHPEVRVVEISGADGWADVRALRGDDLPL